MAHLLHQAASGHASKGGIRLAISAGCLAVSLVAAQSVLQAQEATAPRRVGLALGGGGARGMAHVGVLRVLEELRVPIHCIAGSSMGAVIGGLYAAGLSPSEIEAGLLAIDWDETLSDKPARQTLDFRRKEETRRYTLDLEIGFQGGRLRFPRALISGHSVGRKLREGSPRLTYSVRFDELPVAFRATATDLATGEAIVLDGGDLASALQASMAIPVIFSPIEIEGRWLADGGLTNNLPVEIVHSMGCDIVIAADVSPPLDDRGDLGGLLDIAGRSLGALLQTISSPQRARADLAIVPALRDYGIEDFESVAPIVAAGEAATRDLAVALAPFALDSAGYASHRLRRPAPAKTPLSLSAVEIAANARSRRRVADRVDVKPGDALDPRRLEDDVARVHALGEFERVDYAVEPGGVVRFRAHDKPWGPSRLHFGLRAETASGGGGLLGAAALLEGRVGYSRLRLNPRGGEWRVEGRFGQSWGVESELYQPLDYRGLWFTAAHVSAADQRQPLFDDGLLVDEYDVKRADLALDLGRTLGRDAEARVGIHGSRVRGETQSGEAELPAQSYTAWTGAATLGYDGLDNVNFPHQGALGRASVISALRSKGTKARFDRASLRAAAFHTRGRLTAFIDGAGGASLRGRLAEPEVFRLGGLLSLSGYTADELRASDFAVLRAGGYWRWVGIPPAKARGIYLAGWVEAARLWLLDVPRRDVITGTVGLGFDTGLGAVHLAYGRADSGSGRLYLSLGKTF